MHIKEKLVNKYILIVTIENIYEMKTILATALVYAS